MNVRRRAFLGISVSAIAGAALWSLRKPRLIEAAMPKGDPGEVTIVQFSDSGQRLQKVRVPKVVKSDDQWRKQLSPGAIRHHAPCGHRICLQRKVLEPARQGSLPLYLLRQCAVQLGDEV